MDGVSGFLGALVLAALVATFLMPGSFSLLWDLRGAGRLWWFPRPVKRFVAARWPALRPHLHRPGFDEGSPED